jgi:hypothetical protein
MADLKTSQLTDLAATPAAGDLLMLVDVSDTTYAATGTNKKLAASYVARSDGPSGNKLITGSGRELTVPGSDTAATLAQAQTFTKAQTITPDTVTDVLTLKVALSSFVNLINGQYDGTQYFGVAASATTQYVVLVSRDMGTGGGSYLQLGRNTNASTPAGGYIRFIDLGNDSHFVWVDNSGVVRIHTAAPTNANDTAGTIVGAQTSMAEAKTIAGGLSGLDEVFERVAAGAGAVRRFVYRDGRVGGQEFEGVVTDLAPEYGMDRDDEHPQGKSLNEPTIIGDLLRTVAWLTERVKALEAQAK